MCCITFAGWTIDFIQRVWTFLMSGVICTAVCCGLAIAITSGVALGYNYSLAEFVDLKATNITLYIKRGVFNDDSPYNPSRRIEDEGLDEGETNLPSDEETNPVISGRRLDDSIIESGDQDRYENSLIRLTATPYDLAGTESPASAPATVDDRMQAMFSQFPEGSLDQLKAIQGIINQRKATALRAPSTVQGMSTYPEDFEFLNHARRMMAMNQPGQGIFGHGNLQPSDISQAVPPDINRARFAVPDASIIEKGKWMLPKHPEMGRRKFMDYHEIPTYPPAIRYQTGPIRPSRPVNLVPTPTPESDEQSVTNEIRSMTVRKDFGDLDIDSFREKLILEKYEDSYRKGFQFKGHKPGEKRENPLQSEIDYYDEETKGVPARKKRNICKMKKRSQDSK